MSASPQQQTSSAVRPRRWNHGTVPVLGLIGGIGGGKSRVAGLLAARGAVVIDADRVGHEVIDRPDIRRAVVRRFGDGVLHGPSDQEGEPTIDRRALGKIVFSDPEALRDLEALLHPRMEQEFHRQIREVSRAGKAPAIVLDAAILLERGWDRYCDLVVFVDASWDERLRRVASSRGWDANTLRAREAAQWPVDQKRARADVVIPNHDGLAPLEAAADRLLASLNTADAAEAHPAAATTT